MRLTTLLNRESPPNIQSTKIMCQPISETNSSHAHTPYWRQNTQAPIEILSSYSINTGGNTCSDISKIISTCTACAQAIVLIAADISMLEAVSHYNPQHASQSTKMATTNHNFQPVKWPTENCHHKLQHPTYTNSVTFLVSIMILRANMIT